MPDKKHIAYIGFGANLGDRLDTIKKALALLNNSAGVAIITVSNVYETEPVGFTAQDFFLNGVVSVETSLSPGELLQTTQDIEQKLGRTRDVRWGPRTIDLDILLFDDVRMNTPILTIPHPELKKRRFVLRPLADVAARLLVPGEQSTVAQLLAITADPSAVVLYLSSDELRQQPDEV